MFKAIRRPLSDFGETIKNAKIDNFPQCKIQYRLGEVLIHPDLTAEDAELLQSKIQAARITADKVRVAIIDKRIMENMA